ncbi:MAG TPA: hypothetical protein VF070_30045 [Streptosporangiaceae bacterium]
MESASPEPTAGQEAATPADGVWRFLMTPRWIGWHLLMVASFAGLLWLGDWQLRRAMSGNGLSWAYSFEWPLFAVFAVVFWARTIRDEFRIRRGGSPAQPAGPDLPIGVGAPSAVAQALAEDDEDDPELRAYNAYLARLNSEVKGHGKWHGLR